MKKGCYGLVLLMLWLLPLRQAEAQDLQYSQFFANQIDLNPAFAGSQYYHRVIMNYRNQWPELGRPYVTYSFSYDRHLWKSHSGIGVQVQQDRQGGSALKTTTLTGIYSFLLKINKESGIRLAVGAGLIQNYIDWSALKFPDMIDPIYGPVYSHDASQDPGVRKKMGVEFSTGIMAFFNQYHFGASVKHIGEPALAFSDESRLPMKYSVHAGAEFPITRYGLRPVYFTINPLFLFQKQDKHLQMNYGGFVSRNDFIAGAWFRHNFDRPLNAMIFMLGYDNKLFRLAYSFDWTFSKLDNMGSGSHEVSLIFLLGERENRERRRRMKPIPCPKFYRKKEMIIGGQKNVF